jgi:ankyrin repeat protein
MHAHHSDSESIVALLRPTINYVGPDGMSALMGAAQAGRVDAVRFLLEQGA